MKIDGGCHCGNITYTAEIDPENVGIMSLYRLPDAFWNGISHQCSRNQGSVSLEWRRTKNLCKDCRKRR